VLCEFGMVVSNNRLKSKQHHMKTKTKRTDKTAGKKGSTDRTSRSVNTDEQNRITNAPTEEDEIENRSDGSLDVEDEEDREKRRQVEDEHGE
jgi:hypothetical protein